MIDWPLEIKALRKRHALSRAELGKLCGTMPERAVDLFGSFESGNREPSGAIAQLLWFMIEYPETVALLREKSAS